MQKHQTDGGNEGGATLSGDRAMSTRLARASNSSPAPTGQSGKSGSCDALLEPLGPPGGRRQKNCR